MAAKPTPPRTDIPAETRIRNLRDAIARSDDQGFARDDMVLHLTLSDAAVLKRHPSVAAEEISFANGCMRFLGIEVVPGGVQASTLTPREGAQGAA